EAGRYYYASAKNKIILGKYSKSAFLGYSADPLKDNDTGFSDEEVKHFLREYDKTYKRPLKKLLIEYYRVKLNPDLELKGFLLDQLGFKPCGKCYNESDEASIDLEEVVDDLPF